MIVHHIVSGPFVQMIANTHSIYFVFLVSVVLACFTGNIAQATQNAVMYPQLIEVFTTANAPVADEATTNREPAYGNSEIRVYELDGIQRVEAKLSDGLPSDPDQSKRIVLQRIQGLNESDRARMQHAAMGLARAMQYGLDRYPAIVFDAEVAIYGVTDIHAALYRYQQWREGGRQ